MTICSRGGVVCVITLILDEQVMHLGLIGSTVAIFAGR